MNASVVDGRKVKIQKSYISPQNVFGLSHTGKKLY
jgi:hypothetical protein